MKVLKRPEYICILNLLAENKNLKPQEITKKMNEELNLNFSVPGVQRFLITLEKSYIISRQKLEGQRQEVWFLNDVLKNDTINLLKSIKTFDGALRSNCQFFVNSKKYEPFCEIMSIRDGDHVLGRIVYADKHSLSEFGLGSSASMVCKRLTYFGILERHKKENHSCALVFNVNKNLKEPCKDFLDASDALTESIYKFKYEQRNNANRSF